jgi:hypothetical protein
MKEWLLETTALRRPVDYNDKRMRIIMRMMWGR